MNIVKLKNYKRKHYEVSELTCMICHSRWIGVYPEDALLKDFECKCGRVGYVIKTGQTLQVEEN